MNLPKAIRNMKKPEAITLDDHPISLAQTSNKVSDVEYEDDYDTEDMFNGIASMSQQTSKPAGNEALEVRDFSIDTWNGSPGLSQWGYDDKNPER